MIRFPRISVPVLNVLSKGRMLRLSVCLFSSAWLSAEPAFSQPLTFVTQDFPPFSYLEQGRVAGPAAALIRRVCQEMAVTCAIELLPWRRALLKVEQGAYQGVFLVGWNPERSAWLHFSPPLIKTEYGFFVRDSNPLVYRQPENINGYRVAVYGPSNTSSSLEKLSQQVAGVKVVLHHDDDTGLRQLAIGRVDAVYSNRDVGRAMLERLGIQGIRYAGSHRQLSYYVGFAKAYVAPSQVAAFGQAYLKLLRSGEADALLRPYGVQLQHEDEAELSER